MAGQGQPYPVNDAPSNLCGGCTQCCKTMRIVADDGSELSGRNDWCKHCDIGTGCKVYEARPKACAGFQCGWLQSQGTPSPWAPEFRPDKIKCVVDFGNPSGKAGGTLFVVHVDPSRPDAFRKGLFGEFLQRVSHNLPVVAVIGDQRIGIGPLAVAAVKRLVRHLGEEPVGG